MRRIEANLRDSLVEPHYGREARVEQELFQASGLVLKNKISIFRTSRSRQRVSQARDIRLELPIILITIRLSRY